MPDISFQLNGRSTTISFEDGMHFLDVLRDNPEAVRLLLGIEEGKEARLAEAMGGHFDAEATSDVDVPLELTRQEAADLAFMGPAGHHLDRDAVIARLEDLPEPITAEAKFQLVVFRPRKRAAG